MLLELTILVLYCMFGFVLSSLAHEMGHLVIGIHLGWNFNYIVFGPFRIDRDYGTGSLSCSIELNVNYWGGVVSCLPRKIEDASGTTFRKVLIAGPTASLALGALMVFVFVFTHSILSLVVAAESLGMGIVTLLPVPLRTGVMYTDGYRFSRCRVGSQSLLEEESFLRLAVVETEQEEVTLEEVEELITPLLISQDYSYRYLSHYYMYDEAKKRNSYERIRYLNSVDEFREKVPKGVQRLMIFEE